MDPGPEENGMIPYTKSEDPAQNRQDDGSETDGYKRYLQEICSYDLLTEEEERDLAIKVRKGDGAAYSEMVIRNLRLVISNANRFRNRGLPVEDLVQEGTIGLIRAVENFDHEKGNRFSTIATYWIRQAIQRSLQEKSRTIRLPVNLNEKAGRIDRAAKSFIIENGREPTKEELCAMTGLQEQTVSLILSAMKMPSSLDRVISEDDGTTVGDFIEDPGPGTEEKAIRMVQTQQVYRLIEQLSEQEKRVVVFRYGLFGNRACTLEEIGNKFGVTRQRIMQVQAGALRKMRARLEEEEKQRTQKTRKRGKM